MADPFPGDAMRRTLSFNRSQTRQHLLMVQLCRCILVATLSLLSMTPSHSQAQEQRNDRPSWPYDAAVPLGEPQRASPPPKPGEGVEPATFRPAPGTLGQVATADTESGLSLSGKALPSRGSAKTGTGQSHRQVSSSSLWWTVGVLVVVLATAGATLPWLKRHIPGAVQPLPESVVQVLGRRPLDPRTSLQLIRVGTRVLVVGLGPDGARTLAEITEPIEVDVLVGACKTNRPEVQVTKSFQQFFERKVSS